MNDGFDRRRRGRVDGRDKPGHDGDGLLTGVLNV
jgi:hypothetical protein